jgi:cysteine desulfurase / selenocysteine lyase
MNPTPPRIYLDNAATSWPKPPGVIRAVSAYLSDNGTSVGRGSYREALESARIVDQARQMLGKLLQVPASGHVAFCYSGTDAINLCIHGILRRGDHVVATAAEHNAVIRPLAFLRAKLEVETSFAPVDPVGLVDLDAVRKLIRRNTRLVVISHASNVTGAIQPVPDMVRLAKDCGAFSLVDVAQSAGHLPITMQDWGADLVAGSGHKGLLGPLGTGFAAMTSTMATMLEPLRQGGTGLLSESPDQPQNLPDKYEAGNLNAPGIAGLLAGLNFLTAEPSHLATSRKLANEGVDALRRIPGVRVFGPRDANQRTFLIPITIDGWDCHEAAHVLEMEHGIQVRAGLHCAPLIHQAIGIPQGSLRASLGPFNTAEQMAVFVAGVQELAAIHA